MMSKRFSVITYSAVLGGLVLGLLTPAAHGHGNNPSQDTGNGIPGGGPAGPFVPWKLDPDLFNDDGPTGIPVGPKHQFAPPAGGGPASGNPGLRSLVLGDPAPGDPLAGDTNGSWSFGMQPDDSFGGSGGFQPLPAGGTIPSPGTLALLGLAALATKRRRRR